MGLCKRMELDFWSGVEWWILGGFTQILALWKRKEI